MVKLTRIDLEIVENLSIVGVRMISHSALRMHTVGIGSMGAKGKTIGFDMAVSGRFSVDFVSTSENAIRPGELEMRGRQEWRKIDRTASRPSNEKHWDHK